MKLSESKRASRMGDLIMREISMMLMEEVRDPRLEFVTVSGVRMNKNLEVAEILFTASADADIDSIKTALKKASGFMRSQLGSRMRVRRVPELRFVHDTFLEDMVYAKPDEGDS